MLKKFEKRVGAYELRTCDKHLLSYGELVTAEIREWLPAEDYGRECCIAICYWVESDEGFYLKFVGDRPLLNYPESWPVIGELIKLGQDILDEYFERKRESDYD